MDASAAESELRQAGQGLHDNETILFALSFRSDIAAFTEKRITLKETGRFRKKTVVKSFSYHVVKAFALQNKPPRLRMWTNMPSMPKVDLGLQSGSKLGSSDAIFAIGGLLSRAVLGIEVSVNESFAGSRGGKIEDNDDEHDAEGIFALLTNKAHSIGIDEVTKYLRANAPILGNRETVLHAFHVGRTYTLMTDIRMILIRNKDINGNRVQYKSIPFEAIKAFAVQSLDAAMHGNVRIYMWTDLPATRRLKLKLQTGHADYKAVLSLLSDKVLNGLSVQRAAEFEQRALARQAIGDTGDEYDDDDDEFYDDDDNTLLDSPTDPDDRFDDGHFDNRADGYGDEYSEYSEYSEPEMDSGRFDHGRDRRPMGALVEVENSASWFGRETHKVQHFEQRDTRGVETQYMNMLMQDEHIEMWLRGSLYPAVITSKRLMLAEDFLNSRGNRKLIFKSIPWAIVSAYAVRAAASRADSELHLWTNIYPPPRGPERHPPPQCPAAKCISYLVLDLTKGTFDLFALLQILSAKVWGARDAVPPPAFLARPSAEQTTSEEVEDMVSWLGGNAKMLRPKAAKHGFRLCGILNEHEQVHFAFKSDEEITIFTKERLLTHRKYLYRSIPYSTMRAFAVTFDVKYRKATLFTIWTTMPWAPTVKFVVPAKKADRQSLHDFLAFKLIGTYHPLRTYGLTSEPFIMLTRSGKRFQPADAEHENVELLQPGEQVKLKCSSGGETLMMTTLRIRERRPERRLMVKQLIKVFHTLPYVLFLLRMGDCLRGRHACVSTWTSLATLISGMPCVGLSNNSRQ
eukprot:TRINITY_DN18495_c0_g1_i2.p1 TRINITY_DN18495_c0_g1~~TRINITY_DN18495_c0_g1_i2.p1  ORF type:complete len:891 (-),score=56.35 TRINITY_DN18495_c0_g1_i2:181-2577(-)